MCDKQYMYSYVYGLIQFAVQQFSLYWLHRVIRGDTGK